MRGSGLVWRVSSCCDEGDLHRLNSPSSYNSNTTRAGIPTVYEHGMAHTMATVVRKMPLLRVVLIKLDSPDLSWILFAAGDGSREGDQSSDLVFRRMSELATFLMAYGHQSISMDCMLGFQGRQHQ